MQHYRAVQQSNAPLKPSNAATRDKRTDSGEKYFSNSTPAERYWNSMGAENNSKRQNVSGLLQTIFPDGLAPLASKVAKIERKEQAKAAKQAAKQAAALAVSHAEAHEAAGPAHAADQDAAVIGGKSRAAVSIEPQPPPKPVDRAGSTLRGGWVKQGRLSPEPTKEDVGPSEAQGWAAGTASSSGTGLHRRTSDAASAVFEKARTPHHKHYSHGQKLAASILWETASGKSQPVRLRQCLTYSEICLKNVACAELAQVPLAHLDLQASVHRFAQEV